MSDTDVQSGDSGSVRVIVLVAEDADPDEVTVALEAAGLQDAQVYPVTGLVVGVAPLAILPVLLAVPGVLSVEPERTVDADDPPPTPPGGFP